MQSHYKSKDWKSPEKKEVPSKRLAETMKKTYEWEEVEEEEEEEQTTTTTKARGQAAEASKQATYLPGEGGERLMRSRRFYREEAGEESTNPTAASSLGNGMAVALSPLHGSAPLSPLWSITGSVIKLVVAKGKSKNIPAMNFSPHLLLLLLLLHVVGHHSNHSNLHHQFRSKNFAE
jgi:hypothetical protein